MPLDELAVALPPAPPVALPPVPLALPPVPLALDYAALPPVPWFAPVPQKPSKHCTPGEHGHMDDAAAAVLRRPAIPRELGASLGHTVRETTRTGRACFAYVRMTVGGRSKDAESHKKEGDAHGLKCNRGGPRA